jgi:putative transposase
MERANDWRNHSIADYQKALDFLNEYRWSSYKDYAEIKNFPSILRKDFFQDVFEGKYVEQLEKYLKDIDVSEMKYLLLE